jgi:hypothetical protein
MLERSLCLPLLAGLLAAGAASPARADALADANQKQAQQLYVAALDRMKGVRDLRLTGTVMACGEESLARSLMAKHLQEAQKQMVDILVERDLAKGVQSRAEDHADAVMLAGVFAHGFVLGHLSMAPMSLRPSTPAAARAEICDGARKWARTTLANEAPSR